MSRLGFSKLVTIGVAMLIGLAFAQSVKEARDLRVDGLKVEPIIVRPNLVPNPSFERLTPDGLPEGWIWDKRNTDATCTVDRTVKHSGKVSLKFTNGTPFGAHVYGTLWMSQPIKLQPGKPYTLSAYVLSTDPGIAWLGGGADWQFRLRILPTEGKWQRIWMAFVPSERDANFVLRIVTESPTKGFWVDDVKLEEGSEPTTFERTDEVVTVEPLQPEREIEGDGAFTLAFELFLPRPLAKPQLEVQVDKLALKQSVELQRGAWRVSVFGSAQGIDDAPRTVTLRLLESGKELSRAEMKVRFLSAQNALVRLSELCKRLPVFKQQMERLKAKGQDISYPQVTFTVLENFVGYTEEDARKGEVRRAFMQIADMEAMANRLERQLRAALTGKIRFPEVPRWTGTERPKIVGPSFIASTIFSTRPSSPVIRPIFFIGYGHFGQVRADIEKFPRYGINIIQIEFGPNSVFPKDGVISDAPVRETLSILDRAAKAGVAVNLLISPHYFPQWALEKFPHLKKRRIGFLQFCLHAPEGQDLLRRYIATIIPPLKDHPALHSICLTNEPVNAEEPCEFALRDWHAWLQKRHGDIATLNRRWRSDYKAFSEIPLPDPLSVPRPSPHWYDFVRFNQEWFANWHKMLADAIKAIAPDLPVHAKAMSWTMLNDGDVRYGVDAELFAGFSDINGNDSVNFYSHGVGEFAQGWLLNAMAYDLQHSVKDAPVFNSENHLIPDRETRYVPPEHVRAVLWQGAVYGQSATTIWVWERTFDPKSDFAGSIMHRPACAEAVGLTCLDLNRLAEEVTVLQRARPQVAILHSISALVWDGGIYTDCRNKLYTALTFCGLKIGFVTERQLERGELPEVSLLFVPNIIHLSDAAFNALKRYKGRIVLVGGNDLLSRNEYDEARKLEGDKQSGWERIPFKYPETGWRELWRELTGRLKSWGEQPIVCIGDEKGEPIWGIAWRCAEKGSDIIVNLCNYRHEAVTVTLWRNGKAVGEGYDLISGERIKGKLRLEPLQPRLVVVKVELR